MDQKKTGQFIAALRRNRNMTQRQLAEKLDISEKTISKWECGNGLPEVTYMEPCVLNWDASMQIYSPQELDTQTLID